MKEITAHRPGCLSGLRYAGTIRRTKATIASGTAGKIVLVCKTTGCPAVYHA